MGKNHLIITELSQISTFDYIILWLSSSKLISIFLTENNEIIELGSKRVHNFLNHKSDVIFIEIHANLGLMLCFSVTISCVPLIVRQLSYILSRALCRHLRWAVCSCLRRWSTHEYCTPSPAIVRLLSYFPILFNVIWVTVKLLFSLREWADKSDSKGWWHYSWQAFHPEQPICAKSPMSWIIDNTNI